MSEKKWDGKVRVTRVDSVAYTVGSIYVVQKKSLKSGEWVSERTFDNLRDAKCRAQILYDTHYTQGEVVAQ